MFDSIVTLLNSSLSDTKCMLPSMGSLLMIVGPKANLFNIYVVVIFYNFRISSVLEKYCGVYLRSYLGNKKDW